MTLQVLKERNKYDQIPSELLDQLQRISLFANKVADEIVCKETEILEKIIPRMFEVMQMVARVSCDYVKRGKRPRPEFSRYLINFQQDQLVGRSAQRRSKKCTSS
jgi:hypothetical protein